MISNFPGSTQSERYQNGVIMLLERICTALESNKPKEVVQAVIEPLNEIEKPKKTRKKVGE